MFTHYKEPEKSATTAMRSLLLMPGEVILLPTRCIDGLRSEASVSKRKRFLILMDVSEDDVGVGSWYV